MGPTKAYINHSHLAHNFKLIKKAVHPARVMAVVKAEAYGHGSIEAARTLLHEGAAWLGVAFAEEGIKLRQAGIKAPILVFGAQLPELLEEQVRHNLDITLSYKAQIKPLIQICRKLNKKARLHIKFDTGMGRVGFPADQWQIAEEIFAEKCFEINGIYSHLSSADEDDPDYTLIQVAEFKRLQSLIKAGHKKPLIFHLANSAAIMRLPEAWFDMVRPGVMLYGNPPGPDFPLTWDLKEVMRFTSQVAAVKELEAGSPVSYSRRYHTKEKTKIAVIPAGYADGYNRLLTNRGQVLIGGKRYTVAGTVCMDQFMVDLGPHSSVKPGDEVVLFGEQGTEHVSIVEVSRQLNTIPYEVTCNVSARVPRIHQFQPGQKSG